MRHHRSCGFSLTELVIVLAVIVAVVAILVPVVAKAGGSAETDISAANLIALSVAHATYAADWNGRQVTYIKDDMSTYGDTAAEAFLNYSYANEDEHPWMWLGAGTTLAGQHVIYGYAPLGSGVATSHTSVFQPIDFVGQAIPSAAMGWGCFRVPNVKAFHDYVNGRFYEETYYTPADFEVYESVEELFSIPAEFISLGSGNPPRVSSYCTSPAALFDPAVMRASSAGGWQDPWLLDTAFTAPNLNQALYPHLKTHMIEHHWNQNAPADVCIPGYAGIYEGCQPYFFNHALASEPVALFYDGSVRLLPNSEVIDADHQIFIQTGGVDGLWSRDTPFGRLGYFGEFSYDGTIVSHHVLTTDGILGRDTISP